MLGEDVQRGQVCSRQVCPLSYPDDVGALDGHVEEGVRIVHCGVHLGQPLVGELTQKVRRHNIGVRAPATPVSSSPEPTDVVGLCCPDHDHLRSVFPQKPNSAATIIRAAATPKNSSHGQVLRQRSDLRARFARWTASPCPCSSARSNSAQRSRLACRSRSRADASECAASLTQSSSKLTPSSEAQQWGWRQVTV